MNLADIITLGYIVNFTLYISLFITLVIINTYTSVTATAAQLLQMSLINIRRRKILLAIPEDRRLHYILTKVLLTLLPFCSLLIIGRLLFLVLSGFSVLQIHYLNQNNLIRRYNLDEDDFNL